MKIILANERKPWITLNWHTQLLENTKLCISLCSLRATFDLKKAAHTMNMLRPFFLPIHIQGYFLWKQYSFSGVHIIMERSSPKVAALFCFYQQLNFLCWMNIEEKFEYKVHSQWQEKEWWATSLELGTCLRPLLGKTFRCVMVLQDIS